MLLEAVTVICPYCWQQIEIVVDLTGLPATLIEDCSVCCQPMLLIAARDENDRVQAEATRENA